MPLVASLQKDVLHFFSVRRCLPADVVDIPSPPLPGAITFTAQRQRCELQP
jgi:hypothetical protein